MTHNEGARAYGWGHPFFGLGTCEFPLMTGYIHTIYPRQTVSFKMGSPLKAMGVINADVSTGIAGWLNRKPDMLPVRMKVLREADSASKTFNVQVVRKRSLLPSLVYTVLTNSVDMEGELPEEVTADLEARIEVEGHAPVVIKDTFSGPSCSGGSAPRALYQQIAAHVWAVVEDVRGNLLVATHDEGKIYQVSPEGKFTVAFTCPDSQVRCLAPGLHGSVYAGTGPKGRIYQVNAEGKPSVFYRARQDHVLCLALGPKGVLFAGTGKGGLVYRMDPKGKGFVLYHPAQAEDRSLVATPDAANLDYP